MIKKRQLGNTGFEISELGYGCGGFWGLKIFNERKAIKLVHQAVEMGVNFFDTGSSYSGGNAEPRLGKALKNLDTSNLLIGTKVGTHIDNKGRLYKDFSRKAIEKSVQQSLDNLTLNYIPLLQFHLSSLRYLTEEALQTIVNLKKKGTVRFIGASCDGNVLAHVLELGIFDVVMCSYSILNQKASFQIEKAYKKKIGVLLKSPMGHSLYSNRIFKIHSLNDIWYFLRILKNYRGLLYKGFKYRFVNKINGLTGHEIALRFVLENPFVSCAVMGTTNPVHLKANCLATEKNLPIDLLDRIKAVQ